MILPEAADSDAALLQALFKLVEQHTRTYVQPALRAAAQLQNTYAHIMRVKCVAHRREHRRKTLL